MQKKLTKYVIWSSTRCFSTSSWAAGPGVTGICTGNFHYPAPFLSNEKLLDLDITYTFSKAQEKSRGTAESRGRSKVSL